MSNDIITIHGDLDLIYSADDNGWYFQEYPEQRCSEIYLTKEKALQALKQDNIKWERTA